VGEGLFDYGDKDGKGANVRLQHPLGIVHYDGLLYVADTYNNKIKIVSPKDKSSVTFLGTGKEGLVDGKKATFDEPGGLSIAFGKIYIADTNNHSIRVADLKSKRVETIQFKNLEKLRPFKAKQERFTGETIMLPLQTIEPGEALLTVQLDLPDGYKLNALAPSVISLTSSEERIASFNNQGQQIFRNAKFPLTVPLQMHEGDTSLNISFVVYYCQSVQESLCFFKEVRLNVPVKVNKGTGSNKIVASYSLTLESPETS
jgi:hypothetical protein